jgi:hypothetical protein
MTPAPAGHRPGSARPDDRAGHTLVLADSLGRLAGQQAGRLRGRDRALASWHGFALDERLAAGASPDSDRLLAARARALVDPGRRQKLARDWGRLVRIASERPPASVQVPLRRDRIVAAEPEIRRLQDALRARLPVPVRGVAMASRLLADATGPVYSRRSLADLRAVLQDAIGHLDPSTPLLPGQPDHPAGD